MEKLRSTRAAVRCKLLEKREREYDQNSFASGTDRWGLFIFLFLNKSNRTFKGLRVHVVRCICDDSSSPRYYYNDPTHRSQLYNNILITKAGISMHFALFSKAYCAMLVLSQICFMYIWMRIRKFILHFLVFRSFS